MSWILIILAAVALLALAAWAMPNASCITRQIDLPAAPEEVWKVMTDYAAQPSWHAGLEAIEPLAGSQAWIERHSSGAQTVVRVLESDPPRRITWEFEEKHRSFVGRWDAQLEPIETGTRLIITQRMRLSTVRARLVALILVRRSAHVQQYLRSLDAYFRGLQNTPTPKRHGREPFPA